METSDSKNVDFHSYFSESVSFISCAKKFETHHYIHVFDLLIWIIV